MIGCIVSLAAHSTAQAIPVPGDKPVASYKHAIALLIPLLVPMVAFNQANSTVPTYLDPKQSIENRVLDLLGRMTLEEKVGQMNMPCVYLDEMGKDIPAKLDACRRLAEGTREKGMGPWGGYFTLTN